MNTEHTAGPWEIIGDSNGWYSIGENQGGGSPVVRINEDNVFPPDVREANARLISSAPELLAALKAIASILENDKSELAAGIVFAIAETALLSQYRAVP